MKMQNISNFGDLELKLTDTVNWCQTSSKFGKNAFGQTCCCPLPPSPFHMSEGPCKLVKRWLFFKEFSSTFIFTDKRASIYQYTSSLKFQKSRLEITFGFTFRDLAVKWLYFSRATHSVTFGFHWVQIRPSLDHCNIP